MSTTGCLFVLAVTLAATPARQPEGQCSSAIVLRDADVMWMENSTPRRMGVLADLESRFPGAESTRLLSCSPGAQMLAFVGKEKNRHVLFLLSASGQLDRVVEQRLDASGTSGFEDGTLLWSPDGSKLVFAKAERLWVHDLRAKKTWRIEGGAGKEDTEPSFVSNDRIRFMRGQRFEYSFSGVAYEIPADGSKPARRVPRGKVSRGEDLRGEQ
jgi:hypothetical protein